MGNMVCKFVSELQVVLVHDIYPNTDIYFLNYGVVDGVMMQLYDQEKLVGITTRTKDVRRKT